MQWCLQKLVSSWLLSYMFAKLWTICAVWASALLHIINRLSKTIVHVVICPYIYIYCTEQSHIAWLCLFVISCLYSPVINNLLYLFVCCRNLFYSLDVIIMLYHIVFQEQFQFALAAVAEEVHAILKALPQ